MASANLLMAYCSKPGTDFAKSCTARLTATSAAPAPGRRRPSLHRVLAVWTASSTARSRSSKRDMVAPRNTMVAILASSSSWESTVTRREESSCTPIESTYPISSSVGTPKRTRAVAPVAAQMRRSSNLLMILSTMIPYFSKKCMAISLMDPPEMATLTPASASPLMASSIMASSERENALSSSALLSTTVPLVSVSAASMPMP
mmetsp:Transcript_11584/g.26814  ORF Transcript_11584/g.26814 Transcript_11584/m.26814 type:complete len:204 (-) Transcript_11584:444-1055(-)